MDKQESGINPIVSLFKTKRIMDTNLKEGKSFDSQKEPVRSDSVELHPRLETHLREPWMRSDE